MNKVKVKILQPLANMTGISEMLDTEHESEIEISKDATIEGLIYGLGRLYGPRFRGTILDQKTGNIRSFLLVTVNSHLVPHSAMRDIKLNDGDVVSLLLVYSGG